MQKKTSVVLAQNSRRLRISTMRFNDINGDLLAQQNPQILRVCSHPPARVVQPSIPRDFAVTLFVVAGRWVPPDSPVAPTPGTPHCGPTSTHTLVTTPAPPVRAKAPTLC